MKTTFTYDHYYKYDEIKSNLEFFAAAYPELIFVETNCVTEEGRNQFAVTLTNKKTGDPLTKPGWYLDGNIHAGEVTSSMAAMHTLDYLLTNYGTDEKVTLLLDSMTIYIIPRVTPDGAETYLTTPYSLRSVNREYMGKAGGIKDEDLDGDGVIRMMRIQTPYGAWKKDPDHEGSMVKRDPGDVCGEFYDIYPEGVLESYDGDENLKTKRSSWGLDFNRNFPYGWFPDGRQQGAGKYPLSNPETKAIVDFVLAHPNIGGAAIGHTSGGLLLYPPGTRKASSVSSDDINAFKEIAEMGKQETGYKPMNIFDSFMSDQTNYDSGALDDWFYQAQGIPAYTVEFWDLASKAGVPAEWGEKRDPNKAIERFNACMKWVKEHAPQHFAKWKEFDHPTFGKVEIGGFNAKFTHQNPPEHLLLTECENDTRFNIRFAFSMPHLTIEKTESKKVGDGIYEISAIVGNLGYLPTNLTDEAVKMKLDKPVKVAIFAASKESEDGASCKLLTKESILAGKAECEIGNLSGYSRTRTGSYSNISTFMSAPAKKKVTWIIKASEGDSITIKACSEKAGKAEKTILIK